MSTHLVELEGVRCIVADDDGDVVRDADGARKLVEAALGERARLIAVPVELLDPSFFELRSGLAGEVLQKIANYHMTFAVVGDVSEQVAASKSFHDLVVEADHGNSILFVRDLEALPERLRQMAAKST